jgi:hypothetical protein
MCEVHVEGRRRKVKLEELRKLFDANNEPKTAEKPHFRVLTGIDLGFLDDPTSCEVCGSAVVVVEHRIDPLHGEMVRARCPKCDDECSMCHKNPNQVLWIKDVGTDEVRHVCDECRFNYWDILADRWTTEKQD